MNPITTATPTPAINDTLNNVDPVNFDILRDGHLDLEDA